MVINMNLDPVISDETLKNLAEHYDQDLCQSFVRLSGWEQDALFKEAAKRAHISIKTAVDAAMFDNDALAMALEAKSAQRLYDDICACMIEHIDDCIDEFNDAIEEARSEPARPLSDFI